MRENATPRTQASLQKHWETSAKVDSNNFEFIESEGWRENQQKLILNPQEVQKSEWY